MWPGIALGALAVNAPLGPSFFPVLAIVIGNTLAPVCAYLLLRRVGFRIALDRLQDALALVFLGALAGMVISATIGTTVLVASEALSAHDFWPTWSVWWTGDAMGVLVIAPLLLAARTVRRPRAAPCALISSVAAIYAGAAGVGPFSGHDLLAKMVIPVPALAGTDEAGTEVASPTSVADAQTSPPPWQVAALSVVACPMETPEAPDNSGASGSMCTRQDSNLQPSDP
ncbi:MASE1 domain-containing protein [Streptomyces cyaneus]|uniref:MASE1 domain-containing protein n=1 Tax=Streptomyces cyaneus TaxID=1904 RepID=UPI00319E727D